MSEEREEEVRRFERRLDHRPEKVWRALTEAEELAQWFPASVEGDVTGNDDASLRFVFRDGDEPDTEGTVIECDPPRVLEYTMGCETLRWELHPTEDDGTLLVLTTTVANDNAGFRSMALAA